MSVIDRVRALPDRLPAGGSGWLPPLARVPVFGALAALASWTVLSTVVALTWALTPGGEASLGGTLALSSGLWFLVTGGQVSAGALSIGIVPLLAWVGAVWVTLAVLRRARELEHIAALHLVAGHFLGGYAAAAVVFALLSLAGPVRPSGVGLIGVISTPAVALALDLWRELADEYADRLPQPRPWLTRAGGPIRWGVGGLATVTALVLLGALVARWETVIGLYAAADAGLVGALALTGLQLLFLPNLMLWALSVLAGPGFQVAAGGSITLSGADPGLLPMVPALGLLPGAGPFPGWAQAALAIPVAVGALVGWSAQVQWTRLADWRDPARTAAVAVGAIGLLVLGLALLSTGPAGVARLSQVGPNPWLVAGALTLELALGAALWQLGAWARERLRPRRPGRD